MQFPYSCAQEACGCRDAGFFKPPAAFHEPLPNSTLQCKDRASTGVGNGTGRCPDYTGWPVDPSSPVRFFPVSQCTCTSLPLVFGCSNVVVNLPWCVKSIPNPCLTPRVVIPSRRPRTLRSLTAVATLSTCPAEEEKTSRPAPPSLPRSFVAHTAPTWGTVACRWC